jgi:thiol-disulfide isomerase/thioredoxin
MLRFVIALVVSLTAMVVSSQSLTEVAKKEKARRKQNAQKSVPVRTITESDIAPKTPPPSSTEAEPSDIEKDQSEAFELALEKPPAPVPSGSPPSMGPAPDFDLEDRTGKRVALRYLRGKPVLLDFWATWCAPCRATMPEVELLHRKYRGKGLEVIGINIEGKSEEVLDYLNENRYSFTILFDSGNWDSVVAKRYNVTSIPQTVLIDKDGNIVFSGNPSLLETSLIEAILN